MAPDEPDADTQRDGTAQHQDRELAAHSIQVLTLCQRLLVVSHRFFVLAALLADQARVVEKLAVIGGRRFSPVERRDTLRTTIVA